MNLVQDPQDFISESNRKPHVWKDTSQPIVTLSA